MGKTLLATFMLLGLVGTASAETVLAHINVQQLVNEMPATKAAQAEIKRLEQTYRADLERSVKELQDLYTRYQNEAQTSSTEENAKRAEDVQKRELNIRQTEQMAGQELQKKQVELLEPIFKQANDAIQKVARAKNIQYVLDSSAGQGLVFAGGADLMADVKKELGF
jgi:outer membrane protein